ncbi:MAG TPA: NAD(P)H-binding protein [Actinocrinis sp.]|nr:NAD(P)H-binding protein [Actinocrinis sp.]
MKRIMVFGAGGRAGQRVVTEALARGHEVTAVVRSPIKYRALGERPNLVYAAGDAMRPDSVYSLSIGHDAVVSTVYDAELAPGRFFGEVARALVGGLNRAGVSRLVTVGIGSALETVPGVAVHDAADFPAEYREFSVGHAVEIDVFQKAGEWLDWVVVTPPPVLLDADAEPTGRYRVSVGNRMLPQDPDPDPDAAPFSYADLATALVDEAVDLHHHRTVVAVDSGLPS